MPFSRRIILVMLACTWLLAALIGRPASGTAAPSAFVLDGQRDATYGPAIATDPGGDLANPGPGSWSGTLWSDLTKLYCGADSTNLFVYVDLPAYAQNVSSGEIGLLLRPSSATNPGGSADPWGNAITFNHANRPYYVIRGNIPGISDPPNDNNGWTELRTWQGSTWSPGGSNWGGIPVGGQIGSQIAYANAAGVELKIPFSAIGGSSSGTVALEFFATQKGATKGAYDTAPGDDQATGWDDATTLTAWVTCTLSGPTPTPSLTPSPTWTPTPTPSPTPTATPGPSPTPGPTPTPGPGGCASAVVGDGVVTPDGLYHLDTDPAYRDPLGNIGPNDSAEIRLRTCLNDVQQVKILVWKTGDPLNAPSFIYDAAIVQSGGVYATWSANVPGPGSVIDQWYQFRLIDGATVNYYHPISGNTGVGQWSAILQNPSWKLGTNPPPPTAYPVPGWVKDAVIYQIFPDRFRNGDTANDSQIDGRQVYGPGRCPGYPHDDPNNDDCLHELRSWNEPLLVPSWGFDYYGGDLSGIIDKINAGYFNDLGVNTLYFNPLFEASANHGYDTNDYYAIRSYFGDNATFDALVTAANAHGLRIILDAVFNHAGQDSRYLDPWGRWSDVGACESAASIFRPWFTPGNSGTDVCVGGWGWLGWSGYDTLPEFVDSSPAVRDFFYRGGNQASPGGQSVSQFWLDKGIAGWRYDVAQSITHNFFSDMRPYIKGENQTGTVYGSPDYLMLGEVTGGCDWYLYQSYLNANELDSVMNYCFRDWAAGFGNGNAPSSFNTNYNNFRALFPDATFYALMNLISSHDSPRMLHLLNGDAARAKLVALLQLTLPGAPSIYYGDEVNINGGGDPDNRRVYPWADTGGGMNGQMPDMAMYTHYRTLLTIRQAHPVLRWGDVATALVDDARHVYAYVRFDNPALTIWDENNPFQASDEVMVVALNNGSSAETVTLPLSAYLPDGAQLTDLLNGGLYTVADGSVTLTINSRWGAILQAELTPPPVFPDDLYLTFDVAGEVGGMAYGPEDIVKFDGLSGLWSLHFDGSDLGITADLDAFELLPTGDILVSFDASLSNLGNLKNVDDSDLARFIPTSLGNVTAGTFVRYFDASDVGLTKGGEDVDAVTLLANGHLLVSTAGNFTVPGVSGVDEDILEFTPTSLGGSTSGSWALYFDGSDVGLGAATEDVWGLWLNQASHHIYLSVSGAFTVPGLQGDAGDIFVCAPGSLGDITTCAYSAYWDGSTFGFDGEIIDDFHIVQP